MVRRNKDLWRRNSAGFSSPLVNASGTMSRIGFLKGLGVGAAGLGAAAVGLGRTAKAYVPPEGPGAVTVHFGVKYGSVPCYGNAFFVTAMDHETGLMIAALGKDPDDPYLSQTLSEGVGVFLPDEIPDYFDYPGLADIVNMRTKDVPVVMWEGVPSLPIGGKFLGPNEVVGVAFGSTLEYFFGYFLGMGQPPDVAYFLALKETLTNLKNGTLNLLDVSTGNVLYPLVMHIAARGSASLQIVRTSVKKSNIIASGQGALDLVYYNPQTQLIVDTGDDKLGLVTVAGISGIATNPLTGEPVIDPLTGNPWGTIEQIKHLQVKLIPEDE